MACDHPHTQPTNSTKRYQSSNAHFTTQYWTYIHVHIQGYHIATPSQPSSALMRRLQRIPLHLQRDSVRRGQKNFRLSSSATRTCKSQSILQSTLYPRNYLSLGLSNSPETTNGALLCARQFASRTRNEFDGIVPAAYRNHDEDRQRGKLYPSNFNTENNSRTKENRPTSSRHRKRNQGRKSSSSEDLKKKIISLQLMDVEMANMVKEYEDKLGRPAFYQNTFDEMGRNFGSFSQHRTVQKHEKEEWARKFASSTDGQLSLVQTEKDYSKLCLTLRKLIGKWSTIKARSPRFIARCLSSGEHQSGSRVTLSSLPFENAFNYTIMLESLRKQRAELIYTELSDNEVENQKQIKYQSANGMITWLNEKVNFFRVSNETDIAKSNVNLKKVKDLTAHVSPKYTTYTSHYDLIMRSFIQSNTNASNQPSKDETFEAILSLMNRSVEGGNPNCIPDRCTYNLYMIYYQNNPTLKNSKKSFDFLKKMIQNRKQNMDQAYHPSRHSYNIVLTSFKNAVAVTKDRKEKIEALSYVEMILDEIESDESDWKEETSASSSGSARNDDDDESSSLLQLRPYQVALNLIWEIGDRHLEDYFERIDNIIIRMIGKEAYTNLYSDVNADLPKSMNGNTLGVLIKCLTVGNREQVDRAKVLLFKMQRAQNQSLNDETTWDFRYPDCYSYNSVFAGILYSMHKQRGIRKGKINLQQAQVKKDALYATRLLDNMMEKESSIPTRITFYRLLRIWTFCISKESGERAEDILSRMNIHACLSPKFSDEFRVSPIELYTCAIGCWRASVKAECPGAVKRAALLVERITSQSENLSMYPEQTENDSSLESKQEIRYLYTALLRCCAENSLDQDKADALEIAFDTYNKILEENIQLTPLMFTLLLQCCSFAPNPQKQRNLSQKVFDSACAHGLVSDRLLKELKRINFNLYQSYTKDPEHSMNNWDKK